MKNSIQWNPSAGRPSASFCSLSSNLPKTVGDTTVYGQVTSLKLVRGLLGPRRSAADARRGRVGPAIGVAGLHVDRQSELPDSIWTGNRSCRTPYGPAIGVAGLHMGRQSELPDSIWAGNRSCRTPLGPVRPQCGGGSSGPRRGPIRGESVELWRPACFARFTRSCSGLSLVTPRAQQVVPLGTGHGTRRQRHSFAA